MSLLDTQVVILARLVCDIELVHHRREDDDVAACLGNAFLSKIVESRRDVLFDRRQQLCGGESRIDVEFARNLAWPTCLPHVLWYARIEWKKLNCPK